MKLQDLIKEEGKKVILINKQEVKIKTYIPITEKELMANEIIEYVFAVEKDSNNKFVDAQPTYNKFLLEVVKSYMIVKRYLIGIDVEEDDNYIEIHDFVIKNKIIETAIREIPDVKVFLILLDNKIKQLIKLGNVNRQEDLLKSVSALVESFEVFNGNMTSKTILEIAKLEKEIEALPETQDEIRLIADAIAKNKEEVNLTKPTETQVEVGDIKKE